MNFIRLIYFFSIIGTFVFLGSSVALIVSFIIGHQLHEFVPQFILWGTTKWVILGGAIACLLFAIANIVMWSMLRRLQSSKKSKMVGELMYILGLRYVYDFKTVEPSEVSSRPPSPSSLSTKSSTSTATMSTESIMGLGYDDNQLWTYRGQKPYPLKEPTTSQEII
jgi:hypothetical protein